MKRFLLLIILIAVAGYSIWPAFSMYQIYQGLETRDESVLQNKVDWPSVRASFKQAVQPIVAAELRKQAKQGAGGLEGALAGQLGAAFAPKLVDIIVETYMTPKGLIKLANAGGQIDMNAVLGKMNVALPGAPGGEDLGIPGLSGGLGDLINSASKSIKGMPNVDALQEMLGGKKKTAAKAPSSSGGSGKSGKPAFGIDNIKSFGLNSPSEIEISIAKNPKARKPDLTVAMGFQDMDWKLIKIIPHL